MEENFNHITRVTDYEFAFETFKTSKGVNDYDFAFETFKTSKDGHTCNKHTPYA